MRRLVLIVAVIALGVSGTRAAPEVPLPGTPDSLKFAVIGDNGNGEPVQYDLGQQMATAHARFPFDLVLMLGDNMLGRQNPEDFGPKFEKPYAALLQAGVPFFAALGNHDNQSNRFYKGFNMGGERYYSYARRNVRFVVLDTNLMDPPQLTWLDATLKQSTEPWKIVYFHHPIYSDGGRHGSNVELRVMLEPIFVRDGVNVVFASHDHVYERIKPQKGIYYFVEGAGGQLRKGDVNPSAMTAASYDADLSFMLVEIGADDLTFQTISRSGRVVDSGVIHRQSTTE